MINKETLFIKEISTDTDLLPAAEMLRRGGLVIIPTETVYGLGCSAYSGKAAYNVYEAKNRPHDNPLIVHVSDPREAEGFAYTTKLYYKLAEQFMPGPITVILNKKNNIPDEVTAGGDTVGVRCPLHPVARRLIKLAGVPVAAPSANLSGRPSPTCFSHCVEDMKGRVDVIVDGGECAVGLESTVVLLTGEDSLKILRPGAVGKDALSCVCGNVTIADGLRPGEAPLSPGMKYKHYAPKSPLILLDGERGNVISRVKEEMKGEDCLFICYDEDAEKFGDSALTIGSETDEESHAHRLFAALREADAISETRDISKIFTYMPSVNGNGISPAIYNRLIRAADHTVVKV